jgi:hypothetical protein
MLAKIEKEINERVAHFSRRREGTRVVTTSPRRTPATHHPIDRTRHPNGQTGHASGERSLLVGFHQEVHVVGLYGKLQEPKPGARRLEKPPANFGNENLPAEARQASYRAQGHMDRLPAVVHGACVMARARPSFWTAACPPALATPTAGERQRSLT